MYICMFLGLETDLGAMWIQSKLKDNPIMKIVDKYEIQTKRISGVELHSFTSGQTKVLRGDEANKLFSEAFTVRIKISKFKIMLC